LKKKGGKNEFDSEKAEELFKAGGKSRTGDELRVKYHSLKRRKIKQNKSEEKKSLKF